MKSLSPDRKRSRLRRLADCALIAGALIGSIASHSAQADVPGRVGRISFIQGDVQSYSETEPEWKVAYANEPITSHNSIFVGDASRAEVSVGSTTLAMDAGSQVDIQQLDDNTFNANVVRGRVSMRVRRLEPNDAYNVAVPGAAFALLQPGRYRLDALEGTSGITVFAGTAGVQSDRDSPDVTTGHAVRVETNARDPDGPPQLVPAPLVSAALDEWVVAREDRFRSQQAERYVSPNMTGYEDLDANGRWASEPDVGPVWYPTTYVAADWAPYRYGRWAYVEPWGYTWVDDAPWGFAPFHYGRWLEVNGRWGWCPGAYVARPVFAPALVGFYGGSGFSASFSIGAGPAVGWYPLAPWERFSPGYAHSAAYINQVNNIAIVNVPPRFAREGARDGGWNREHGATMVPREAFASQRSISRVAIAAPRGAFDRAGPVGGAELPRPNAVPGAVRRGPEGPGANPRPEFRAPRDFAQVQPGRDARPNEAYRQAGPQRGIGAAGPDQRAVERSLPPNYQRLPETNRPAVSGEAARVVQPGGATPVQRAQEQGVQPRGPNPPAYSREGRPVQAQPQLQTRPAEVPNPASPPVDRLGARSQAMERGDGEAAERGRQQAGERSNRDFRPPQPVQNVPAPAAAPVQRPQPVERPQAVEQRQPIERPQRVAPVTVPAPRPQPVPQAQAQPHGEPNAAPGAVGPDRGRENRER